ncbi:hypothetical protein V1477_016143, partial [Vespula maculifrons]
INRITLTEEQFDSKEFSDSLDSPKRFITICREKRRVIRENGLSKRTVRPPSMKRYILTIKCE